MDLGIVTQDNLISNIVVSEHLTACDHKVIRINIGVCGIITVNKILVPSFTGTNFVKISGSLRSIQVSDYTNVDEAWQNFRNQ